MALVEFATLVGVVVSLAYVWFYFAFRERLALASKIPGPTVYPVIGNLYMLLAGGFADLFQQNWERSKLYPKVAKVMFLHRVGVFVWNAEDAEVILSSTEILEKSQEYRFFKPWLGNGLLISSGNTWRSHRRLIAPTFHVSVLKQFVHLFNRNSKVLCDKLAGVAGQTVDIHDYLSETTVEILLETAMGVDRSTQKRGYDYAMAVMKMCAILHRRQLRPWLWPELLFGFFKDGRNQKELLGTIHGLTSEVLKKRKVEREAGVRVGLYKRVTADASGAEDAPESDETNILFGQPTGLRDDLDDDVGEKKRIAFLDQMLDAEGDGATLSDQDVADEVNTIMFEGHDTTAAASSFFLSLLGVHTDIQERCVAEQWEIFGDSDRPASFQDTLEMNYLERCIMETLRLFPPVPILARRISENLQMKSGYVIPEGTTVVVTPFLLHRDADVFPNPNEFNPDNFLPERCARRNYYSFVPFSAGPRSCVGRKYAMLKLKIILSTILRKFKVKADIPHEKFRLVGDIILKRKEGFPVRFYPRDVKGVPASTVI